MTQRRRLRWVIAPVLGAALVVTAMTWDTSASAGDHPQLPARTAAQLLTAVQQSTTENLSGTVKVSARLGLPSIPDSFANPAGISVQTFLTGTHTFRVWVRGAEQQRVALIADPLAETDVIHNDSDLWTYDSQNMKVTHATLSAPAEHHAATKDTMAETPAAAANDALQAIDPTTAVSVDRTARVAGRPAYQLVLRPRDGRSLVGSVQIAIDSARSVPLRVQVFSHGSSKPAYEVGFTSVHFTAPKASIFRFHPPKGATVSPASLSSFLGSGIGASGGANAKEQPSEAPAQHDATAAPRVIGTGWTAVAVIDAGRLDPNTSQMLSRIGTRVAAGQLITTKLVSVLISDDGHIFIGSVSGSDLQRVAVSGRAL